MCGVERAVGVLEHELDPAAQVGRPSLCEAASGLACEPDLARERAMEPGEAAPERRLAAAALTDDGQARPTASEKDTPRARSFGSRRLPDSEPPCRDSRATRSLHLEQIGDRRSGGSADGDHRRSGVDGHAESLARPPAAHEAAGDSGRGSDRRHLDVAPLDPDSRSAVRTGIPAGRFHGSTALPGIPRSSRVSCRTRGIASSRRRVYGCRGSRTDSSTGAVSTMLPPYMTATASTRLRTTPRSWLT